jgi:hypothetical protein
MNYMPYSMKENAGNKYCGPYRVGVASLVAFGGLALVWSVKYYTWYPVGLYFLSMTSATLYSLGLSTRVLAPLWIGDTMWGYLFYAIVLSTIAAGAMYSRESHII